MKIINFKEVDSTNEEVKRLVLSGKEKQTSFAVTSDIQINGKGRHGRSWFSDFGGIYCSCYIKNIFKTNIHLLNFSIGIIIFDEVMKVVPELEGKITLKWPNDIYIENKKLGGILIESVFGSIENVIVGFGINVANENIPEEAISLRLGTYEKNEILNGILTEIEKLQASINFSGEDIIKKFLERVSESKKIKMLYSSSQYKFEGYFRNIDLETGAAIIEEAATGKLIEIKY